MSDAIKVGIVPLSTAVRGIMVVFCDDGLKLGPATVKALGGAIELVKRAASAAAFKGKSGAALDILAPEGVKATRLIVIGAGKAAGLKANDFLKIRRRGGEQASRRSRGHDHHGGTAQWRHDERAGGCDRLGPAAAQLQVRPLQDQEEGRRGGRLQRRHLACRWRCRRREEGVCIGRCDRGRRDHCARPRQRTAERAFSRGVRAPRRLAPQARRQDRGARREGDGQARHGRAARRRPGLVAAEPDRDHALGRRQEG
ncbi:hypothetical protein ACVWWG_006819 [Bradyrhizobium sp. LB7.2]